MKLAKTTTIEELQVVSKYESLRKTLLTEQYTVHLEKPLAYWALPTDRRLPLAFLGRTLRDLLGNSFEELASTPGIGQKKMRSFLKLLSRVANTDAAELDVELYPVPEIDVDAAAEKSESDGFDPSTVSEVVWAQWRASIARHGLGKEPLGRFAPSLRNMTRVIWNAPLEDYATMALADMRALRTHGEKRVSAVLEVFYSIHAIVSKMGVQDHLVVRIVPRRIDRVESWVERMLQTPCMPSSQEVFDNFVSPLLDQIRVDATRQIASLAENRLGLHAPVTSVRQVARSMGLTRARVYQLLNEINDIVCVRWPMGRHQVYELVKKLQAQAATMENAPDLSQFYSAVELFYPNARRGADGPLEPATADDEDMDEESEVLADSRTAGLLHSDTPKVDFATARPNGANGHAVHSEFRA